MSERERPTTSRGMPIVSEETIKSLVDTYLKGRENWGQRLQDAKARMVEEQPALVNFIEQQVGKYPPEIHLPIFEIAVAMYTVLEQQANSDMLSRSFSVNPEKKE